MLAAVRERRPGTAGSRRARADGRRTVWRIGGLVRRAPGRMAAAAPRARRERFDVMQAHPGQGRT
ncbi:MAG: hypothetical protein AB7V01_21385, partial [Vicinamibacterales bacterium]